MSICEKPNSNIGQSEPRPPYFRERFMQLQERVQNNKIKPIHTESLSINQVDIYDPLNQEIPFMEEASDVIYEKMLTSSRFELRQMTTNLRSAQDVVITTTNQGIGDSIKGIKEAQKIARTLRKFHAVEKTGIKPEITIVIPKVLNGVYQNTEMMSFVSDSKYFDHDFQPNPSMVLIDLGPFSQLRTNSLNPIKLLNKLQTEDRYIFRSQRSLEYFMANWYDVRSFEDVERDSATKFFSAIPTGMLYAANLHQYIESKPSQINLPETLPEKRFDCIFILDAKEGFDYHSSRGDTASGLSHDSVKSIAPETFYLSLPYQPENADVAIVMGVSHPQYCEEIINLARRFKPSWKITIIEAEIKDLIEPILASNTVVTTDNGIGHLANEVLISAQPLGYKGRIRQIFNADYEDPMVYAIANIPGNSSLVLMVKTPGDVKLDNNDSLKLLDPKRFAEFIWRQR